MKPRRVALLVETSSSWGAGIITGVSEYVRAHDRWVLYVDHRGSYERQNVPTWWEGDGIIARVMSPTLAQHVRLDKIPCVNVSQVRVPDAVVQHVTTDEQAVGRIAAETLLKTGAAHYVYYGPPKRDHYVDRIAESFAAAVAAAGHQLTLVHPDRVLRTDTNPHFNLRELSDWMLALPRPVAILTWNAVGAFRLLETAAWAGIRVPDDDVYILSADTDELLTRISSPKLSAIDHDPVAVGRRAAEELHRLMNGGTIRPEILLPPGPLLPGESLPELSHRDPLIRRALSAMTADLTADWSVPMLATKLGVSRRTLEVRFRDVLNSSPAAELRRMRVEQACRMLSRPDPSVAAVAKACGFSSIELLQRAMQKLKGMTPSEFRERSAIAKG